MSPLSLRFFSKIQILRFFEMNYNSFFKIKLSEVAGTRKAPNILATFGPESEG